MSNQSNILTITEGALRSWIRSGVLPVRKVGNRNLVYYPTLVAYLCGSNATPGCTSNSNHFSNSVNKRKVCEQK